MPASTTTLTTTNPSHSLVLVDYELHRSSPPATEPHSEQQTVAQRSVSNPLDWPANHRRVPAYRPVNTALDPEERIVFNNRGEQMFIRTMFFGIQVVTVRPLYSYTSVCLYLCAVLSTNYLGIP